MTMLLLPSGNFLAWICHHFAYVKMCVVAWFWYSQKAETLLPYTHKAWETATRFIRQETPCGSLGIFKLIHRNHVESLTVAPILLLSRASRCCPRGRTPSSRTNSQPSTITRLKHQRTAALWQLDTMSIPNPAPYTKRGDFNELDKEEIWKRSHLKKA